MISRISKSANSRNLGPATLLTEVHLSGPCLVNSDEFASAHCLIDHSSGAAIATLNALRLLSRGKFRCGAVCASKMDAGIRDSGVGNRGGKIQKLLIGDRSLELRHHVFGGVPVQVFETASPRIDEWSPGEPEAMLAAFERVVQDFRPEVIVTYGGDAVTRAMVKAGSRESAVGEEEGFRWCSGCTISRMTTRACSKMSITSSCRRSFPGGGIASGWAWSAGWCHMWSMARGSELEIKT